MVITYWPISNLSGQTSFSADYFLSKLSGHEIDLVEEISMIVNKFISLHKKALSGLQLVSIVLKAFCH